MLPGGPPQPNKGGAKSGLSLPTYLVGDGAKKAAAFWDLRLRRPDSGAGKSGRISYSEPSGPGLVVRKINRERPSN